MKYFTSSTLVISIEKYELSAQTKIFVKSNIIHFTDLQIVQPQAVEKKHM